jgi:hypothetical protein
MTLSLSALDIKLAHVVNEKDSFHRAAKGMITGLPMGRITKPIVPMVLIPIAVFLLCTYVPDLVLILPRLFMKGV